MSSSGRGELERAIESNSKSSWECFANLRKIDFPVFLSAFSSFHWSILENAENKVRKFFVSKSFAKVIRYSEK